MYSYGSNYSKKVQKPLKKKFEEKRLTNRLWVVALMKKFEQTGIVQNRLRSGRPLVCTNCYN